MDGARINAYIVGWFSYWITVVLQHISNLLVTIFKTKQAKWLKKEIARSNIPNWSYQWNFSFNWFGMWSLKLDEKFVHFWKTFRFFTCSFCWYIKVTKPLNIQIFCCFKKWLDRYKFIFTWNFAPLMLGMHGREKYCFFHFRPFFIYFLLWSRWN